MEFSTAKQKSTHVVPVICIDKLEKHPNADTLCVVKINDFSCCVKTDLWKEGDLAAWIPPDSIVDIKRPEFSSLDKPRIRAKKIRQIVSYGFLVPAPKGLSVGDNAAEILGVTHYDPIEEEIKSEGKSKKNKSIYIEQESSPAGTYPTYDVDNMLSIGRKVFKEGELVSVTEKIHGENTRVVFSNGQLFVGSRNIWKKRFHVLKYSKQELLDRGMSEDVVCSIIENVGKKENKWWEAVNNYPGIIEFCRTYPNHCVYGELYGSVKGMKYGSTGQNYFAAFDILKPDGRFMDPGEFQFVCGSFDIPTAFFMGLYKFNMEELIKLASGKTNINNANHIREGIVVKPVQERWDEKYGRVCCKVVSPEYYEGDYNAF